MRTIPVQRVHATLRGSSWPVLVDTEEGRYVAKLRGAAQGTLPLAAEMIVGALAEELELSVPKRVLLQLPPDVESLDRHGELRDLLRKSEGLNLGLEWIENARDLHASEVSQIPEELASRIAWLDAWVLNPDRTERNPNLLERDGRYWLIDHGAALSFHFDWGSVTDATERRVMLVPHLLRSRATQLAEHDASWAARFTPERIRAAVDAVPDAFLDEEGRLPPEELSRRREGYVRILSRRLEPPRPFVPGAR